MEVRERRRYRRSGKVGNLALPCLRAISQESSFPTAPHPARLLTRRQHPPTAFVSHDTARHSSHGTARTASGFAISSRLSCRILVIFFCFVFFCRDTGLDRARLKKVEETVSWECWKVKRPLQKNSHLTCVHDPSCWSRVLSTRPTIDCLRLTTIQPRERLKDIEPYTTA